MLPVMRGRLACSALTDLKAYGHLSLRRLKSTIHGLAISSRTRLQRLRSCVLLGCSARLASKVSDADFAKSKGQVWGIQQRLLTVENMAWRPPTSAGEGITQLGNAGREQENKYCVP